MESVWKKNIEIPRREKLEKELHTEVVVLGGGMAGASDGLSSSGTGPGDGGTGSGTYCRRADLQYHSQNHVPA